MATKKAPTKTTKVAKKSNGQKKTTTKVVKVKTPIYLKEGVTGKQMMAAIYKANNSIKAERASFSRCLEDAKKIAEKEKTFENIKGFKMEDCTPRKLMHHRSKHRIGKETFSAYEVLMMMKKMYQVK